MRKAALNTSICPDTTGCCRALSRVWQALGVDHPTGQYVWELVAQLRLAAARAEARATEAERAGAARCPNCAGRGAESPVHDIVNTAHVVNALDDAGQR